MGRKYFILVFFLVILLGLLFFMGGTTAAIRDKHGNIMANSVAKMKKITLGGVEQWILVRGHDLSNPVLLWLHGGPGAAQMPIAHYYNGDLEKEFIVVHWDQRGAGKSNTSNFNQQTLTFDQFLGDAHELTKYLKSSFNKEKIYLVGHSWGSLIGSKLVYNYPEDFYGYISIGQVINCSSSHELSYNWLKEQIKERGDGEDWEALENLGPPPFIDQQDFAALCGLIKSFGGGLDEDFTKLSWIALNAPEYNLRDFIAWKRGKSRGGGPMWDEARSFELIKFVPEIKVPVYFIAGQKDYITPLALIEKYYHEVKAPAGKELIIFQHSAHAPFMAEQQKFNNLLFRIKGETLP